VSGVVAALVSVSMMAGSWLLGRYMKRFRYRTTLLIATSLVITISTIAVGLAGSFWLAVPLFLVGTLASGIMAPVKQGYLHQVIPSEQRATVISFNSMMDSAGGVIGQTGLGYIAERQGIAAGFVVGGVATVFAIPFLYLLYKLGDPADQIKSNEDVPLAHIPATAVAEEG
jgi:MFS family permease